MKDRPYSWIFTTVLVLMGLSVAITGSVAAQSTGYVDVAASDLSGSGTADDPYIITNASELQAIEDDLDANYTLGNDINASSTRNWNNGSGFKPIGPDYFRGEDSRFSGKIDGRNRSISHLYINRSESPVGIFSATYEAEVRNVNLSRINISGGNAGGIMTYGRYSSISSSNITGKIIGGDNYAGGTVGYMSHGTVSRSHVDAKVNSTGYSEVGGIAGRVADSGAPSFCGINSSTTSGSIGGQESTGGIVGKSSCSINSSSTTAEIAGEGDVGGIVGDNTGKVKRSYAIGSASISGSNRGVGGIAGGNAGSIEQSASAASVTGDVSVGGIAGQNDGQINNSYTLGSVDGRQNIGGIVGRNGGRITLTYAAGRITGDYDTGGVVGKGSGSLGNSYWDTETTGQSGADTDATGLTTAQMTGSAAKTNMSGLEFGSVWQTQPDDYPVLKSLPSIGDSDTDEGDDSDGADSPTVGDIAYYADSGTGIVGPGGLGDAASNFRSGEIGPTTLGEVAAAFRSGEPVV